MIRELYQQQEIQCASCGHKTNSRRMTCVMHGVAVGKARLFE